MRDTNETVREATEATRKLQDGGKSDLDVDAWLPRLRQEMALDAIAGRLLGPLAARFSARRQHRSPARARESVAADAPRKAPGPSRACYSASTAKPRYR